MRGYNRILMLGEYRRALVWPLAGLFVAALALGILAIGAEPAGAAPKGQASQNRNPSFADPTATRTVPENSLAGTAIGEPLPTATDPDNDTLIYTLAGTDKDSFHFEGSTRQISVINGTTLNYENGISYNVVLQVSDRKNDQGAGDDVIDDTIAVAIHVTDVNEPPGKPATPTVRAADADGDTTLAISWTAPDNAGRPDISDYDVQYRAGNSGSFVDPWSHTGTGTSTTISESSSPTLNYQVQVRARNDEGVGEWSDSGTGQTGSSTTVCTALVIDQDDNYYAGDDR